MRIPVLICLGFCLNLTNAVAQDRYFAFSSQSNVIPKNTRQIEVWYANKSGGNAYFSGNYARVGFKMGLGKNLLSEFLINVSNEAFIANEIPSETQTKRVYDNKLTQVQDVSFTNEIKFKISDPVANPIGCAIYNDLTIGTRFIKFNPKLILDKRMGQNFFTLNLSAEFDKKFEIDESVVVPVGTPPTVVKSKEVPLELSMGYMNFSKNNKFGIGVELKNHNEVTAFAGWEHSVLFLGPAVHFRDETWFFNLSLLPQIGNLRKSWIAPDSHVWDEHQKFELRTVLGFIF
jgi:hypothetical protein